MTSTTAFKPALIIVDLQEDFCPPTGSLAVPNGRDVIPTINALLNLPFAIKICTKDWHPADHISFATSHANKHAFTDTTSITHPTSPSQTYETRLWPPHCIQSTPGAALVAELDTARVDVVIEKGQARETEMYSAFQDPFGWQRSGLEERLRKEDVSDVFVVGLAGDYCVKATAVDAAALGWGGRVWVVDEGVRCVDQSTWGVVTSELAGKGVSVVRVDGEEVERVRGLGQ